MTKNFFDVCVEVVDKFTKLSETTNSNKKVSFQTKNGSTFSFESNNNPVDLKKANTPNEKIKSTKTKRI